MKQLFSTLFLLLIACVTHAQTIVGRQQVITLTTGDGSYPTSKGLLWLPDDYASNPTKKYPLIIANHGVGEAGTDITKLITASPIQIAGRIANGWNPAGVLNGTTYKYIVFSPQCPTYVWSAPHLLNILTYLKANYRVNDSAVFVTGLSAGSWGIWRALDNINFARQVKAICSVAPLGPDNIAWMDKAAGLKRPLWLICGTADDKYATSNNMYEHYTGLGAPAIKSDIAGAGHTTWLQGYDPAWHGVGTESNGKNVYDWFLTFKTDSSGGGAPAPCGNIIDLDAIRGANKGVSVGPNQIAACDTVEFSGRDLTYTVFYNLVGTPDKHIVIRPKKDSVIHMTKGISIDSCMYVDVVGYNFSGTRSDSFQIKIHDEATPTEVGVTIKGLSKHISVKYTEVHDKTYGWWIKHESNQTSCDSTEWYPATIEDILVQRNKVYRVTQEGEYGGSTDPLGTNRSFVCNGQTIQRRSAALKDIRILDNEIWDTYRTGIQLSAVQFGTFEVARNKLRNSGGWEGGIQWPAIWIGGGSSYGSIHDNDIDSSYGVGNIINYGTQVEIYNNKLRHNGVWRDWKGVYKKDSIFRNPYANNIATQSVTTSPYLATKINIHDNDVVNFNTAPVGNNVYIYGTLDKYVTSGNVVCRSGNAIYNASGVALQQCTGTPPNPPDTLYDTVVVHYQCDTTKTVTVPMKLIPRADSVLVTEKIIKTAVTSKAGLKYKRYAISRRQVWEPVTRYDTIKAHDSTFVCRLCKTCDSLKITPRYVSTKFGVFINSVSYPTIASRITRAKSLGVTYYRQNMNYGQQYFVPQIMDSGLNVALTFNFNDNTGTATFLNDSARVYRIIDSLLSSSTKLPNYLNYYNEQNNPEYWQLNAMNYIQGYKGAIAAAHKHGIWISDGGFIISILFNMFKDYQDRGYTGAVGDSLYWFKQQTGINNITSGVIPRYVGFNDSLFTFIKSSNADYTGVHVKEPQESDTSIVTVSPLTKLMCSFLSRKTGKPVITTEAGTRNHSQPFLYNYLDNLKAQGMPLIVYYAGTGATGAVDLSEDLKNYLKL